jgi:hypothetical protein
MSRCGRSARLSPWPSTVTGELSPLSGSMPEQITEAEARRATAIPGRGVGGLLDESFSLSDLTGTGSVGIRTSQTEQTRSSVPCFPSAR